MTRIIIQNLSRRRALIHIRCRAMIAGALISVLALSGCSLTGKKADPSYYLLSPSAQTQTSSARRIGLYPVELPAYARQEKIASMTGASSLSLDDDNRWAEPPESAVSNALLRELSQQSGAFVALRPYPRGLSPQSQIKVVFDKFVRQSDGSAVMEGQYYIMRGSAETVSNVNHFSISVPASGSDYGAYMQAVSSGLNRLAAQINQNLAGSVT